ncbi:reverse transcriptase [Gossypium australe]|uniref:Reverse transcriptase n=1 Tax=Gossypium australe TaxID=47621 RepID=A0A5B6W4V0_9ROSI|nr:reverse transcriptase [Gossypium australe]
MLAELLQFKLHFNSKIEKEEFYWKQKACTNWLQKGDRNITFFHNFASQRRRMNKICSLQGDDGRVTLEGGAMKEIARNYFQELFSMKGTKNLNHVVSKVRKCITENMNRMMTTKYTKEELYTTLKGMGPTKASGVDGYPTLFFFQNFWHSLGRDVSSFCLEIINQDSQLTNLTNFWPIILCIVIYKMISKTVANRLQKVPDLCIDEAQIKKKRTGRKGILALKLDMSKAYDRVEWSFLRRIMSEMGFDVKWIYFIMQCICTIPYTIIINGEADEVFRPTRGLRQGDPLNPYLSLLCSEGLSSLMRLAQ